MYNKITLDNGLRIVYENIPYLRSATFGIWVENGSRNEPDELSGISHFIEHMVFKGTTNRSAREIAYQMDAIGGYINAFTTKESTCFYFKALDTHLKEGIEVLSDMFFNSTFADKETETERGVILEEIDMYEDTPEDLVSERLFSAVLKGSPLARPILGSKETVNSITPEQLRTYIADNYDPQKTIVAISGSVSEDIIDFTRKKFEQMKPVSHKSDGNAAIFHQADIYKEKKLEQNHITIAFPCFGFTDSRRYDAQVINSAIGGSMSSRLFQEIREKYGMCYSIYSFITSHADIGIFSVYTAVKSDVQDEVIARIKDELEKFVTKGIAPDELERVREQLKTNVLMSFESTSSRMNNLARSEYLFGKVKSPDEILECYNNVTAESIHKTALDIFDFSKMSTSAIGKIH